MKISRRNFLKTSALLAANTVPVIAGLSTMTTHALAATSQVDSDFNFVLFRVIGGMDSVLGLHPWVDSNSNLSEKDLYLNYHPGAEVLRNIAGTQISLGPSAHALAPFAKNMAIVRGMYMGATDVGHPAAIQHMSSGRTLPSAPHLAGYIGSKLTDPSNFVVTNSSIQRGIVEAFPVILTQSLKRLGNVDYFSNESSLDLYKDKELGVNRYLNLLNQKNKIDLFTSVLEAQKKGGVLLDESVALASLASGLSRVVQIDMNDEVQDLDTHGNHANHKTFQRSRWERIAGFLKGLADNRLLEKTLVVVVTEFNRSPGKNGSEGKDHNYSDNAVALFGRGLNGGHVVGDHKLYLPSDQFKNSIWAGSFLNFKTGQVGELDAIVKLQKDDKKILLPDNTDLIHPTDLWATVANSLSSDIVKNLATESRLIPGLFKS